ncbi:hypothetical protein BZG36_02632 [Bifiguratus adelaidae]|uniref:Complex 1 LYR protein domain-containing protein n=1 Tax=Bifiguratus adelaidae TaxID=1938954 RepID=A0A261Y2T2_9FUNG|nr:hypothetical protein BZG36_02632 [Bifiguratus adelaidae]
MTLTLYRRLLLGAKQFRTDDEHIREQLVNVIRYRFRQQRHERSPRHIAGNIWQAEQAVALFEGAGQSDEVARQLILDILEASPKKARGTATKANYEPPVKKPRKFSLPRYIPPKYHQRDSTGRTFTRVKGHVQPPELSMIIKHRVQKNQSSVDRYHELMEYMDMIKAEKQLLRFCGVDKRVYDAEIGEYEASIRDAIKTVYKGGIKENAR